MAMRHNFLYGDPDVTITSQQMEHHLDDCDPLACVLFSHSPSVQVYYALRSRLESCSETWLQEFIELDGLDSFLDCLGHMTGPKFSGFSDAILQIDCLSCIRAVLNSRVGMEKLVGSKDGIWKLLKGVDLANTLPRKQVIEMLSAVCVYSKLAYKKLLTGMDRHKIESHMQHRFSFIVNDLKMAEAVTHKTSVMTLINSIICFCPDISERCHIRNEFVGLTLLDVLSFLQREDPDEDLYIQLQVFQEKKHEDESAFDIDSNLDLSSPQDLTDAIQTRVFGKPKMVSFVNILQDLLAVETSGKEKSDALWQVLERHVHHIVHGIDDIDALSGMETVCQAVTMAVEPNVDVRALCRKISQIDLHVKNQEIHSYTLDQNTKNGQETCSSCAPKAVIMCADSGYGACDDKLSPPSYLSSDGQSPVKRRKRSDSLCENQTVKSLSSAQTKNRRIYVVENYERNDRQVSTYDNMSPAKILPFQNVLHKDRGFHGKDKNVLRKLCVEDIPKRSPSTVKTFLNFGSPQDVPRSSPTGCRNFLQFQKNKIALPAYMMRNLKWVKLDETTVEKYPTCVWMNTEAGQLKVDPDFMQLEDAFREKYVFDESPETPLLSHKTRLSLNLFLNRLEKEPTELIKQLASMDGPGLPLPVIKHLVEILPEHSEVKHLKYFNGNLLNLGPAEQFTLHLSDLPDYQILLMGHLRRAEFAVTIPHLRSVLDSMLEASRTVLSCTALRETLLLVLRLGNFMNHGQYNGYAGGFKLSSLARLADLKSREPGHNFVHFLVNMVDGCDDKLLNFLADVPQFEKAVSYSPAHIKAEFDKMNTHINCFIKQLASATPVVKEGFSDFMEEVKKEFRELQGQITELKLQSQKLADYFCESEAFDIQICLRQLLDFFKQLRFCRQEVQLMRRQKNLATGHSSMFTDQIRSKHMAFKFGQDAGASSSMMEERKKLVDQLLAELHRGNFKASSVTETPPPAPQTIIKNPLIDRVKKIPTLESGPVIHAATPERNLNFANLSRISLVGTPMLTRPKSELYDADVTVMELSTAHKIITSSVKQLADITAPPATGRLELSIVPLQKSVAGSQRAKTHHRSKSDLADSISATTKWIRYHQQARWDYTPAPLARPESSFTLATLNLEAGKRHIANQKQVALTPGPTLELPPKGRHAPIDVEMFGFVRDGKKGERKSGTFSNFLNKISKRVLRQRSNSDQNADGKNSVEVIGTGETGFDHVGVKGEKSHSRAERNVPKGETVGRSAMVTGRGVGSKCKIEDKENVYGQDYNPFDRQKKNPIRLSNRFKSKPEK